MEKTKKPRASRAKKVVEETEPAIFVEEVVAPTPPPKAAAAAKSKSRKPPTVAAVTPEGIQGSLGPETARPLIAHLPIHSSEIESDMFVHEKAAEEPTGLPNAYDSAEVYVSFTGQEEKKVVVEQPIAIRPSLPIHYSEKLMVRFQDANRDQKLPDSTEMACFWDCHQFRGPPCVIPSAIDEGIWRVYGNFCSPACAAAYLFNEKLDSHLQWERYALLNRLYTQGPQGVRLAPARTTLRLFGGTLEVEDFRVLIAEKRLRVDVMTPPMISIIQVMDTKPIDFYDASMKNTFIPWEMDRMNRPGAQGLRLRRTKPVAEKESTLEFCMGIVA
jgi:hypothetical protein